MPFTNQQLKDYSTGNIYEFLETAADSNGERVVLRMILKSKGQFVPAHIHTKQDETFKVISGKMTYILDGKEYVVNAGEHVVLPKGVPHNHYNNQDEPLQIIQTIEPAYDIDYFLENYVGLCNDGKVINGNPGFLQSIVTLQYLESPTYLAQLPISLQKFLKATLGPLARLFGYRALYARYTGIDK